MRVLYLSRSRLIESDVESVVTIPKRMFYHMIKNHPDLEIDWVVPEVTDDKLEAFRKTLPPGITPFPYNTYYQLRQDGFLIDSRVVHLIEHRKYDLILNGKPSLQRFLTGFGIPVLNWHMWTNTRTQMEAVPEYYMGLCDLYAENLSLLYGPQVFESEYLRQQCLSTLSEIVNARLISSIHSRTFVIPNGINTDYIDSLERHSNQRPLLLWGGRFSNQKRPDDTLRLIDRIYRRGRVDVQILTQMPKDFPKVKQLQQQYPHFPIRTSVGQMEFLREACKADLSICLSRSESYGVAWLELLYAGVVVIYLREPWQHGVVPPDYPYVADNLKDVVALAHYVLDNLPEAKAYLESKVKPWILQYHNQRTNAMRLLDVMKLCSVN